MKNREVILVQQPTGLFVLLTSLFLAVLGLIFFSAAALVSGIVLLGFWLLSRELAKRHLSEISVKRELPLRAIAGRSYPVKTILKNANSFIPAVDFNFLDPVAGNQSGALQSLDGKNSVVLSYTGLTKNRGHSSPAPSRISSSWPLGLFETHRIAAISETHQTLIRPRPYFPPRLRRHLEALREDNAQAFSIEHDPTAPFRSLREFRPGDSVRSIHWPGSLQTDDLLVRELDPPSPEAKRFALVFHSYEPVGQLITPEAFELVLRIVSAILTTLRNQSIELVFHVVPEKPVHLTSRAAFDEQLDRLALLKRHTLKGTEDLESAIEDLPGCEEIFIISDCPIHHWRENLQTAPHTLTLLDADSLLTSSRPSLRLQKRKATAL